MNRKIRDEEHGEDDNQHDCCLLPLGSEVLVLLSLRLLTFLPPECGDDVPVEQDHEDQGHEEQEDELEDGDYKSSAGIINSFGYTTCNLFSYVVCHK